MAVELSLLAVLEKSISPEKHELEAAQHFLEEAAKVDLMGLLCQLSDVLVNLECSPVVRMQAGLQLKNALYSKDPDIKVAYQQRWLQAPMESRQYIKKNCLAALGTETTSHSSAAQCVAYIACVELPALLWPELMAHLVQNIIETSSETCKHATLETIGYICQDIDCNILASQSNAILTAIVYGMKKEEPSDNVRLAATNAMLNSLEFTKHNFGVETERNYIMQVICESTQSPQPQIRVAALQCLVKIMSLYYSYMETYMKQALFAITLDAMKDPIPEVSLQGIEFWSTVCDEEIDLAYDAAECFEKGQPPAVSSMFYAKGALHFITPILLEILARQEESVDEDEWNPNKAAGVCLMLLAQCCEDAVVELVIPFVNDNIKKPDWRYREAAVMSFGCILEGPDPAALKVLVQSAMPVIIELLRDESPAVRDTAAWTIGRVCESLPEIALQEEYLVPLLTGLVDGLSAEPRVAANVCWAFSSLADSAYEVACGELPDKSGNLSNEPNTYALSSYFNAITDSLITASSRPDGGQQNLRNAAYSALMALIKSAAKDCYVQVQHLTMIVLERLEYVIGIESHLTSSQDRAQFNDLQSLLCGTLQSVLRKINKFDAPAISDKAMVALMSMFRPPVPSVAEGSGDQAHLLNGEHKIGQTGGVQEDALLAISALLEAVGETFVKYLDAFMPILVVCLQNFRETQVCINAVGLLGDMCRVLSKHIVPHCDGLFVTLMDILQNANANKTLRPAIISTFGDLSLALGSQFLKYLPVVLETLKQATQAEVNLEDPDMVEYLNSLRTSCLEAYTGIIQGLKDDGPRSNDALALVATYVPHIVSFIEHIGVDTITNDELISACCGLVGDLVSAYGSSILSLVDVEPISNVLARGRRAKSSRTKGLAVWASKEIRKLKNAAQQADASGAVSGAGGFAKSTVPAAQVS